MYDIYAFGCVYNELSNDYQNKINEIISYIVDKKFLQIEDGYGILADKKNFWALGWDSKPTDLEKEYRYNPLLLRMELFCGFPGVAKTEWFLQVLEKIDNYKEENGIKEFPDESIVFCRGICYTWRNE